MADTNNQAPYRVIVAKVYSEKESLYGMLLLLVNRLQNRLESSAVVFIKTDRFQETAIDDNWQKIEREIQKARYENNFITSISNDILELFHQLGKRPESVADLASSLSDAKKLKQILFEQIRRVVRDDRLEIEIHSSLQDSLERDPSLFDEKPQEEKPSAHTYIRATLVLDPIAGSPISEVRPGQRIMLKINDLSATAQRFIETNGLMAPKGVKACPAEVVSVERTEEGLSLECAFSPDLRTKIIETERVMVQTPQGVKGNKKGADQTKQTGKASPLIYVLSAVLVILALFMVFIIFS